MKHSWRFLPVVFVFALFASMAAAYAPTIQNLPDIYIGDKEDWWGTVDTNLFRFSDAFNLDDYVDDADNADNELRWSFVESTSNNWLKINGILQLDLLTEDPKEPGAKNIRAVSPMVSLWDLKDSPESGGPIWPDPVDPLNEIVTFYVSDGLFVDSDTVLVKAVDNDYDRISEIPTPSPTPTPTPGWVSIRLDDFQGNTDGYTFQGISLNTYDTRCAAATSTFDGNRVGITTDNTTSRFGWWTNSTLIPYEANKLYKIAWKCSTNQATTTAVPTIRFRLNAGDYSYANELSITSQTGAMSPPTTGSRTYNQYLVPLTAQGFFLTFDVYDFDQVTDSGTVYLEEVETSKADIPTAGWSVKTVPAFTLWTLVNNISPYAAFATTGQTASLLRLGSPTATSTAYAFWNSPNISWTAGKLNRAIFTLSTASGSSTILGAVAAGSADYNWFIRYKFYGASVPTSAGRQYPVYFETASGTNFYLVYEGMDFETDRGGSNDLNSVVLEERDLW